jgi:hypothetical protein
VVDDGRRGLEDAMPCMLACPLYFQDRKLLFKTMRIAPELISQDSSTRLVVNPESFEGWKYLVN